MAESNVTVSNLILQSNKIVQEVSVSSDFVKIHCPSRMVVAGPSMIGKSQFALKLIKFRDVIYNKKFERIVYALPEASIHLHSTFIETLRSECDFIEIVEGLPDINSLNLAAEKTSHKLLIMDDLMSQAFSSSNILELVTSTSHHSNISVVMICQSIFLPAKHRLTLVRNCSEKVLFHNKVDHNQLNVLSRHINPSKPNLLKECFDFIYRNTSKSDLKYVLIDASPLSELPYNACLRTFIFPEKDGKVRPVFFSA